MIDRFIYGELLEIVGEFPVLGIVGPRQVGKTTLARLLSKKINKETIFLDLEKLYHRKSTKKVKVQKLI
jgi:predicted AAA+ superfamily ATPase